MANCTENTFFCRIVTLTKKQFHQSTSSKIINLKVSKKATGKRCWNLPENLTRAIHVTENLRYVFYFYAILSLVWTLCIDWTVVRNPRPDHKALTHFICVQLTVTAFFFVWPTFYVNRPFSKIPSDNSLCCPSKILHQGWFSISLGTYAPSPQEKSAMKKYDNDDRKCDWALQTTP